MIGYILIAIVAFTAGWFICALLTVGTREDAWNEGYHVGCRAKSREEA